MGAAGDNGVHKSSVDDNSKNNGLPDLHAEAEEAPHLSPASDVPVISPQAVEEGALPQLDGLFDDDDEEGSEENVNGGRPSRKRKADGQSAGYRVVPVVADSSSSDDSHNSTSKRQKKAKLNDIVSSLMVRQRDIEKERQLHLALMTEESENKDSTSSNAISLPGGRKLLSDGLDVDAGINGVSKMGPRPSRKCTQKSTSADNKSQLQTAKNNIEKIAAKKQVDGKQTGDGKKMAKGKGQGKNGAGETGNDSDDINEESDLNDEASSSSDSSDNDEDFKLKTTRSKRVNSSDKTKKASTGGSELLNDADAIDREIAQLSKLPRKSKKGERQSSEDGSTSSKTAAKTKRPDKKKSEESTMVSSDDDDSLGDSNDIRESNKSDADTVTVSEIFTLFHCCPQFVCNL
jgi:hypothetical protein